MVTRKSKMAAKYVEFDRKSNFIPKVPKIGLARWSRLSEPTHSRCGPLQRAIVAKWSTCGFAPRSSHLRVECMKVWRRIRVTKTASGISRMLVVQPNLCDVCVEYFSCLLCHTKINFHCYLPKIRSCREHVPRMSTDHGVSESLNS